MPSPYDNLPDCAFWRRAVADVEGVDPVTDPPFSIGPGDSFATTGSCFAQHLSRALVKRGYHYLVTEPDGDAVDHAPFPARFGNIYTTRQLLQLFDRAYGLFRPLDVAWTRGGALVDPFRPRVAQFPTLEALVDDRKRHLACVRAMFEQCDVFVFTLGLTEAWLSACDGAAFPLAPGVAGGAPGPDYVFHNMRPDEVADDLKQFLAKLRVVNPSVRVILTVSPVPLIATYEPRHVLVSNTYSKAALRAAVDMVRDDAPEVAYFPSYEIVTHGRHFAEDQRSVTEEGVSRVMDIFARHYLRRTPARPQPVKSRPADSRRILSAEDERRFAEAAEVVCDEEAIDPA